MMTKTIADVHEDGDTRELWFEPATRHKGKGESAAPRTMGLVGAIDLNRPRKARQTQFDRLSSGRAVQVNRPYH
jgi:hypothetical protein